MQHQRLKQYGVYESVMIAILLGASLITCQILKEGQLTKDSNNVEMKITQIDSQVGEILWCGSSQALSEEGELIQYAKTEKVRKLFVNTLKGQLYLSSDFGFNFKHLNEELESLSSTKNLFIEDIIISPVNNKKVYIFGQNGVSFYTENCGLTYRVFKHDPKLNSILPNPTIDNLLIGLIPLDCKSGDPQCDSRSSSLVISHDNGLTWRQILSNVDQVQWDLTKSVNARIQQRIIIAHYEITKSEDGKERIRNRQVSYTDNFCDSINLIEKHGVQFYQNKEYIFVLKQGKNYGEYKLIIGPASVDYAAGRSEIDLALKRVKDESFTVLDISDGSILISINHEGDDAGYTNQYISNSFGKQFSISLQYTAGDSELNIDFEKVYSNEGTYISNVYPLSVIKKNSQEVQRKKDERISGNVTPKNEKFELTEFKKTLISYNKGGNWHPLRAPDLNLNGNPYKCSGECSLHLKGRTDMHGTKVYSTKNAPGVILGTGNVGNYLTKEYNDVRTYLSSDGGHTWQEVRVGSHEYEIANQGSIIAMARDDMETNEAVYSLDEGETWVSIPFKDFTFRVDEFVTEQSNEEYSFIFFGFGLEKDTRVGYVGAINFQKVFKRVCKGFDTPGEENSDYERWIPQNFSGKKCLFGAKVSYTRKIKDSDCFNDPKFTSERKELEACECTQEDFECDYGSKRSEENPAKCVPLNEKYAKKQEELEKPPAHCNEYYFVSKGYRKIPNNKCQGGVEEVYGPKKIKCPNNRSSSQSEEPVKNQNNGSNNNNNNNNNSNNNFNNNSNNSSNNNDDSEQPVDPNVTTDERLMRNQQLQSSNSGAANLLQLLAIAATLFALFTYRSQITEIVSSLKNSLSSFRPTSSNNDVNRRKENYGVVRQENNPEDRSLFHNEEDEEAGVDQI